MRQEHEAGVLSERENKVLVLAARGKTNKEIAAALTIAENTARNHVSRIKDKLWVTRGGGCLRRDPTACSAASAPTDAPRRSRGLRDE